MTLQPLFVQCISNDYLGSTHSYGYSNYFVAACDETRLLEEVPSQ